MPEKKGPKRIASSIKARQAKTKQMKTWNHIARLAEAGLTAAEARNLREVEACLNAIRGVAQNADEQGV